MKGQRLFVESRLDFVADDFNGHVHEVDLGVLLRERPLQSFSIDSLLESKKSVRGIDSWIRVVEPDGKSVVNESLEVENTKIQEG